MTLPIHNSGEGRFLINASVVSYDQFNDVSKYLDEKQSQFLHSKINDGRPIWVDFFTTVRQIIIGYQSQLSRQQRRRLEREAGKYFKKAETNRMKNQSRSKSIDNLRYLIARAARCSSVNFFPAGFYGRDGMINFLDRGNVSEEQTESVKTDGGKEFTKSQILSAIAEIKESLLDDIPSIILEWEKKVEGFTNDKNYSLFQVIGNDGIDSILDEVVNVKVMVATEVQSVSEMVNFNGKNNPWVFLHFMFQYLDIRNEFQNDEIFEILSEKGEYINLKNFIGYDSEKSKHPETLPFFPTTVALVANDISKYDWENASLDDEKELRNKLKIAFRSFGSESSTDQKRVKDFYDTFVSTKSDLSKFHEDVKKVADVLEKMVADKSMDNVMTKYGNLLYAIETVAYSDNQTTDKRNHARSFIKSRFKDLIQKDSIKLIYAIALGCHNPKFTLEDTSYSNIESYLSELEYELTNGIEIIRDSRGLTIDYRITNDELEEMFKSQAGSWDGKLNLLFPIIKRVVLKTRKNIGTDTNVEHKQKEIQFIKKATGVTQEAWWLESNTSGKFVRVGILDGKLTRDTSWQHLEDKYNQWELGCIEENSSNSGEGRKIKPNKLKSYRRKLENVNDWYEAGKITKNEYKQSMRTLQDIIEHIEDVL